MGYRDDFFVVENMYGYTGDLHNDPTVYFMSNTEHARITQDHDHKDNIGRDVVKSNETYSIENLPDENNADRIRAMEFEYNPLFDAEIRVHKSRNPLVLITATTTDADRAILSQSIWKYTELKTNRRRNSI